MKITYGDRYVDIFDDMFYAIGSADNKYKYDNVIDCTGGFCPSNKVGLQCRNDDVVFASILLLGGGGSTGLGEHTAAINGDSLFVGCGDSVLSIALPMLRVNWKTICDQVACFEVFYNKTHNCIIVHGELEISRIETNGTKTWSTSGNDIFSGSFCVLDDHIVAEDFNNEFYKIDIATGETQLTNR